VSGDEMERHLSLSLGEPEQLRRDMTPASDRNLYAGDATPGSFGDDEQMKVPPDSMFPQLDDVARLPVDEVHNSSIIFPVLPDSAWCRCKWAQHLYCELIQGYASNL